MNHPTGGWTRVCRAADVPDSLPLACPVAALAGTPDSPGVCVGRGADGEVVAMLDRCPHRDVALSGGVVREGVLTCPGHFWRFDLTTGERLDRPSDVVTLYPTRVVDGWVEAQLPEPAAPMSMREWLLSQARADSEGNDGDRARL